MSEGKITLARLVSLGMSLGRDAREETKREFVVGTAEYLGDLEGSPRAAACEKIWSAGIVKRLGEDWLEKATYIMAHNDKAAAEKYSAADIATVKAAFPSPVTIGKNAALAVRFPTAHPTVSLDVYRDLASAGVKAEKAGETGFDFPVITETGEIESVMVSDDSSAVKAVELLMAHNGNLAPSVRQIRDMIPGRAPTNAAGTETNRPDDVGDRIDWLLSQPAAVHAWKQTDSATDKVAALVDLLTSPSL